jgi:hypothetical protein
MIIRLSKQQQDELLRWAAEDTAAHFKADVLPPGYELVISVGPCGAVATAFDHRLELGEVEVVIE